MEAAARPLPRLDTTPPVTKMYFADIFASPYLGLCAGRTRRARSSIAGSLRVGKEFRRRSCFLVRAAEAPTPPPCGVRLLRSFDGACAIQRGCKSLIAQGLRSNSLTTQELLVPVYAARGKSLIPQFLSFISLTARSLPAEEARTAAASAANRSFLDS